jgi:hypothetical protein
VCAESGMSDLVREKLMEWLGVPASAAALALEE